MIKEPGNVPSRTSSADWSHGSSSPLVELFNVFDLFDVTTDQDEEWVSPHQILIDLTSDNDEESNVEDLPLHVLKERLAGQLQGLVEATNNLKHHLYQKE